MVKSDIVVYEAHSANDLHSLQGHSSGPTFE